ncbi:hypothetical protein [Sporomusa acidovorans]|uniref:Uncharacterized protein n=1 Tax=Sporomusa acidovorans (strain ATCC 49682 / DSM 3132 / Mol) TaxID=1123286 RepID=A0ABZ3J933_SPOA4|nr:hypothetical protein [Sporomusa acidovorans]OZC15968.1 hypothetical protein SPACI_43340 [Sporomusa acidovorans DSM 3132]SDD91782.1 hypothetical protein SAMN04488499_1005163 [Sporomusa acidovorans]
MRAAILLSLLLCFLISGCGENTKPPENKPAQNSQQAAAVQENQQQLKPFEIIYTVTTKRFDKGTNLYVLVQPDDYNTDNAQEDLQAIIDKLVKEKGSKTSVDFFDSKQALEIYYQKWVKGKRNPSQDEDKILAEHYVAGFSGDLSAGMYKNTLTYFPRKSANATEYNPK